MKLRFHFALVLFFAVASLAQNSDILFNQGVAAYNQNQFPDAIAKFRQVNGDHAKVAQQFIKNINDYMEAMQIAKSVMDRSPDEQDANNLAFAIQQYERAISIKPDGPFSPQQQLARAREMKTRIEKSRAAASQTMANGFCTKALAAIQQHHYKEGAQLICAVANENPGYNCGGDEAIHMCQVNTDLAKIDKGSLEKPDKSVSAQPPKSQPAPPVTPAPPQPDTQNSGLDKAKAAYDSNDFARATSLFQKVDASSKSSADQYLAKISAYQQSMDLGDRQQSAGNYEAARQSFITAAAIKPDGPGDPQVRTSRAELFAGIDQFYSGDYTSAISHLQNCAKTGLQKPPLVHFYLGASELGKFFVTGSEDTSLQQEAMNDLKQAKQAGFKPSQDLSPKILQAYNDLSF